MKWKMRSIHDSPKVKYPRIDVRYHEESKPGKSEQMQNSCEDYGQRFETTRVIAFFLENKSKTWGLLPLW